MANKPGKKDAKTATINTPVFHTIGHYIHFVSEKDFEKAVEFFSNTLGLHTRGPAAHGWVEFHTEGTTLAIHSTPTPPPARETGISFHVENCDRTLEALKERGVTGLTTPREVSPGIRCFDFKDPFGNTFSVAGK